MSKKLKLGGISFLNLLTLSILAFTLTRAETNTTSESSDSSDSSNSSDPIIFPYQLGLLPTAYDPRDIHYEDIIAERDGYPNTENNPAYPESFSYEMLAVRDQGRQGSCVPMAVAAMKESMEYLDIGFDKYFSPQYIYNQRVGYPDSSGMHFRDAFGVLKSEGIIPEKDYKYGSNDEITSEMREVAAKYKIGSYASINTVTSLKDSIYHNGPAIIGVPVYDSGSRMWHKKSIIDTIEGYHAMAVTGYTSSGFIIRNSWGDDWNNDGYTFMVSGDFDDADSWWTAIDMETGDRDSAHCNKTNLLLLLFLSLPYLYYYAQ